MNDPDPAPPIDPAEGTAPVPPALQDGTAAILPALQATGRVAGIPEIILIVEDEERLARLVADYLTAAGYKSHILGEGTGVADWVRAHQPALVILDLMLPGRDGLDVCRDLRAFSPVPIIMVTARVEEIDRLLGLELGADDYVCKPFSPRELVARVKAVLRRFRTQAPASGPGQPLAVMDATASALASHPGMGGTHTPGAGTALGASPGAAPETLPGAAPGAADSSTGSGLTLDESTLRVHWQGCTVELTAVEFSLLATLHASPGRIYSRNRLMALIYRDHRVVSDRTIDSHIKKLRRKLEDLSPDQEWVHSVYGVGYRYEEQD